jgi:small GTP-binding protein
MKTSTVESEIPHIFQLRRVVRTLPYNVSSVQWSPGGELLAVGDNFGVIRLWDIKEARYTVRLEAHKGPITSISWSPDGNALGSGSNDGTVRLWNLSDNVENPSLGVELPFDVVRPIRQVAWSPTGGSLAVDSSEGSVQLWDVRNGKFKGSLEGNKDFASQLAWSPDGSKLAFCNSRGEIYFWKEAVNRVVKVLEEANTYFLGPSWSSDGQMLAAGTLNGELYVWEMPNTEWNYLFNISQSYVLKTAWLPGSRTLIVESKDKQILLWDQEGERVLSNLAKSVIATSNLTWSNDGRLLTFGDEEGHVSLLDIQSHKIKETLPCESSLDINNAFEGDTASRFCGVTWSPNGMTMAANIDGQTIDVLDVRTGSNLTSIDITDDFVTGLSWSPDGKFWALSSDNEGVLLWDYENNILASELPTGVGSPLDTSWSPDSKLLAAGTNNGELMIWSTPDLHLVKAITFESSVNLVAWSPDSTKVAFAVADDGVYQWNPEAKRKPQRLHSYRNRVTALAWSPDGSLLALGDDEGLVTICDLKNKQPHKKLSGHRELIAGLSWSEDGAFLASASDDSVVVWRRDLWDVIDALGKVPSGRATEGIFFNRPDPVAIDFKPVGIEVQTWEGELLRLFEQQSIPTAVTYTSAKVVLVGDSNVGKSCLALRLADDRYEEQGTTHGMRTWSVSPEQISSAFVQAPGEKRDITLWDMGGQDEYRLIHQLFLHDTTLALVLFDPTRGRASFSEVEEWSLRLDKQLEDRKAVKFLIGTKLDEPTPLVNREEVKRLERKCGFSEYFETSAKVGRGIKELGDSLVKEIDWDALSKTTRLALFQRISDKIQEKTKSGEVVTLYSELEREISSEGQDYDPDTMNAVVRQLSLQGLVVDTRLATGQRALVLQVGEVERYAGSLIVEARNNPRGVPAVEAQSVTTMKSFPGIRDEDRLQPFQERIVVECVVQLLLERNICLAHEGLLIFPSLFKFTESENPLERPATASLYYDFSGAIDNIYTTLIVRLSLSDGFGRVRMRQDGAEFEKSSLGICEVRKVTRGGGLAHLDLIFSNETPEETRSLFTLFVEDHLRREGVTITEGLSLTCSECSKYNFDEWVLRERLREGQKEVVCPLCEARSPIMGGADSHRENNPELVRRLIALKTNTNTNTKRAVAEMRNTIEESSQGARSRSGSEYINILHLSDVHMSSDADPFRMLQPLARDLEDDKDGFGLDKIDYFVISGDLTNRAAPEEFDKAYQFISELAQRFHLTPHRCVIVPGNHDQSWDTKNIYRWVKRREVQSESLRKGSFKELGTDYAIRDDKYYPKRFENFSKFYHSLVQQEYPLIPEEQCLSFLYSDTGIQFLTLNSSWEIDEYFPERSSINDGAISRGLLKADEEVRQARSEGRLSAGASVLRIGVWHHPITGNEKIRNDAFIERLQAADVKLCLHGHVHEEKTELMYYLDPRRKMYVAGAGTVGAVSKDRPESTPRLYSLIQIAKDHSRIRINTRARRRDDGKWAGWNVWPSPNEGEGRSYYDITL